MTTPVQASTPQSFHPTTIMAAEHPIFNDIYRGDVEAVKQHVLANPAVLEEKGFDQMTPLI